MKISKNKKTVGYLILWVIASILPLSARAETIGLAEYLQQIQAEHPFFKQQALDGEIERAQQQRFLGDEDWVVSASPGYRHSERTNSNGFTAEKRDGLVLGAGLARTFWSNGGRISVDYHYSHIEQQFAAPLGTFDEHGNGLSVTYMLPLMKNRGGELSRLEYELQRFTVDHSDLASVERREAYLEQHALLFIDWVFVDEQQRIAANRLALADKELIRTKQKRRSRLVAEVDVLRARDAVINARQHLSAIKTQWLALQAELATHAMDRSLYQMSPHFDLYALKVLPSVAEARDDLHQSARQLHQIDVQLAQSERLLGGLDNQLAPELELMLSGGLNSEADHLSGSTSFDQPQYALGLNFRYPLGQRTVRADVNKARLQQQQLRAARSSLELQLEAQLRNFLVQLEQLEGVMALNREQIEVAQLRTKEELSRHNQGRSELSFVIQSRDNEQNAQFSLATNAARYQKIWLRYTALMDVLIDDLALNDEGLLP